MLESCSSECAIFSGNNVYSEANSREEVNSCHTQTVEKLTKHYVKPVNPIAEMDRLPDQTCSTLLYEPCDTRRCAVFRSVFVRIWGVACICRPREAAEAKEDQMNGMDK